MQKTLFNSPILQLKCSMFLKSRHCIDTYANDYKNETAFCKIKQQRYYLSDTAPIKIYFPHTEPTQKKKW